MVEEGDIGDLGMSSSPSEKRCDESKCLSTGLMPPDSSSAASTVDPLLFNCYAQGPGTLYPYICADDYIGVRISSENVATSADPYLHYYTCCTPGENDIPKDDSEDDTNANNNLSPVRECNNPEVVDAVSVPKACSGSWTASEACQVKSPSHPYARFMTFEAGFPLAYMCCNVDSSPSKLPLLSEDTFGDSSIGGENSVATPPSMKDDGDSSNGDSNVSPGIGLDDKRNQMVETILDDEWLTVPGCGPRISSRECHSFLFCDSCTVENKFANLQTMNCYNDVFRYPQVMMMTGNTATYKCCSVPQDETVSPFVVSSTAYLATIWTQFALALIASLMSCLLIVSIGRSFYLAKKMSPYNTTRRRNTGPDYSSYNLYLVLLALPGLVYNLFILGIVADEYNNGWIPQNDALITICAVINQCMNAIIAREILTLLRRTKNCQRCAPPSLKKACIQFGIVAAYATALGVFWLYLLNYSTSNSFERAVRATVAIPMRKFTILGYFAVVVIAPAIYLLWVCFEIWRKDLLPKSEVTIGQNLRFNITSRDTPPTSQKSLKNLFFTFRKGANERYIPPTTATSGTEDCRDNTFNTASSNRADSRPGSTNGAATTTSANANYEGTTATARNTGGRLNMLAMYFLHIIMVFFFLWLPGMIMYYIAYQTNQNASGLLHNLGLIFFSMQAIVQNGISLLKPDVRTSTSDLWKEVRNCCCKSNKIEDGHDNATTHTAPASSGKIPERWQEGEEGDIEVPIQGEPKDVPPEHFAGKPTKSPVSNIVTVHHEITNIGGVQVSQLTTHTISSFNSSSHVGGDDNGENGNDDENDEGLEFGFVPPPPPPPTESPRNPSIPRFLILDGDGSLSEHEKDSKDEKKKKKKKSKKEKEKEPSDGWASGSSSGGRASLRKELSTSPVSAKRKKKRLSGSHITDSPSGPPKRRNSRGGSKGSKSSPSSQERMRKRLSGSHRYGSDSSSIGKHVGPARRNSLTNSHRYGSDSSSIEKPVGPPRRNSLTGLTGMPPVNKSPTAPSRKNRINSSNHDVHDPPNGVPRRRNSKSDNKKSKSPKTKRKQLNGMDSPAGKSKKTISSNDKKGKSPVIQPKKLKSPVVKSRKASKSPTAQRKKKLDGSGNHVSEPHLGHQNTEKIKTNSGHARKSPTPQSKKKRDVGKGNESRVQRIVEQIESPRVSQRKGMNGNGSGSHAGSSIPKEIELKISDDQFEKSLNRSVNTIAKSTRSMKMQMEKRISNTSSQVSASSDPSRNKKRISNSRGISYDGTVIEHCRSSISETANSAIC